MRIKPIQNDRELEVSIKSRDKFEKAIGDIISRDIPMSPTDETFHEAQLDSLMSVKDELDRAIQEYQNRLRV